ncbi:carboxylesterase [Bartonella sp. HY038]|uniref:alpha/beta hydrolase n=1 Tax=Bartonella sp. HY038 TaxID=2759660 RepID=UPI0015FC301D|nr:alpha/beta fold hydrolase [Bartonella sp. HY038]
MISDVSFYMPGGRAGVMLIHGLTGTPTEMHILAKGLNKAGFSVFGMQLAGHCGDEADIVKTNWQDWYQSVNDAADAFLKHVDTLFVGGLSMGALLALKLAAERPKDIAGVGVYGATLIYDGWSIPYLIRRTQFLILWLYKMGLFHNRVFIERPPYGLKDERIRKTVADSMFSGDSTKGGLAGNPFPSLAEMMMLVKNMRPQIDEVRAPCLVMHSANDDIANIKTNGGYIAEHVAGPVEFIPLDNSYHLITIDRDRKNVINKSVEFFSKLCSDTQLDINDLPEIIPAPFSPVFENMNLQAANRLTANQPTVNQGKNT